MEQLLPRFEIPGVGLSGFFLLQMTKETCLPSPVAGSRPFRLSI
jgi:hypothetical protein